jgi:DNA-binding PadR family transcriptional regulator
LVYKVVIMTEHIYLGEFEQLVLLAVLRAAQAGAPASGVAVARELEEQAGRRVSRGALYTTLDRLEGKGLLRWRIAPGGDERGALPRRAYAVTARGTDALRASQRTLQRMWRGLEQVLKERP